MKKNVDMYEILETENLVDSKAVLPIALFKDEKGTVFDLEKLQHILTCGSIMSGREASLHAFIVSLLHKFTSDELKFLMIDSNLFNLFVYNDLPHMLCPVIKKGKEAIAVLNCLNEEMNRRYRLFSILNVKNIFEFNTEFQKGKIDEEKLADAGFKNAKMPRIVCVIDEYMPFNRDYTRSFNDILCRIVPFAKAAGVNIILSTGRPSADVVTNTIKSCIYNILCFKVVSGVDSKSVLGIKGAENLKANTGLLKREKVENIDMYCPSDEEVEAYVEKIQGDTQYDETFLDTIEQARQGLDPMLKMAIENILKTGKVNLRSLKNDLGLSSDSIGKLLFKLVKMEALSYSYRFSAKKDILQRIIDED